jgi:predicted alpha/beta superfamily hydrolase
MKVGGISMSIKEGDSSPSESRRELTVCSSVSGEQYRLLVWKPVTLPSSGGFPCLYALDGDDHFAMLTDQAVAMSAAGLTAPVIVGIGYSKDVGTVERRIYELTPRAERYDMPARPNGVPWPRLGGGEDLLETIERDIKPRIAALCGEKPSTVTLFGHSLGGLMVLHAFSSFAGSYDCYFASSPSIWFNGRKIIGDIAARLDMPFPHPTSLAITVGSEEEDPASKRDGPDADPTRRAAWVASNRMIGNARDLAHIIREKRPAGLNFAFDELPGANHRTVLPYATRKALDLAGIRRD